MSPLVLQRLAGLCLGLLIAALPALGHAQQTRFANADDAANAFAQALATSNGDAVRAILGPDYRKVLQLDEVTQDDKLSFLSAWAKSHRVVARGDAKAALEVGESNWTLPIPIVKTAGAWVFDTRAGADEMTTRRIGRNELSAMEATLAYFDMQKDYARKERQPGLGLVYAQKFRSTPGKKDGLYWPTASGEEPSPMGPGYAATSPDGAYHGYFYRILSGQGKNAKGGAYDYINRGRMNGGFALVAWPAKYGSSGIMSFMVNHDGVVFEKNLGPGGSAVARGMQRFDPDASWRPVQPPSALAAQGGANK